MNKKLIIFDLDGTLVDAYGAIIKSVRLTLKHFGCAPETDLAIRRAVGWGDRNLIKAFIPGPGLDRALLFYRRVHAEALKGGVRWLPHALGVLRSLKKKRIKLAIASNRPTRFTHLILRILDGRKYFDAVLCADRLPRGKPDPLILNRLVKRFGVPKKEVLFVGDMAIDIQTAHRAGIDVIAVATGSSTLLELKALHPNSLIKTLSAFPLPIK